MDPDAIKARIKELGPWRQNIDLGNGITTGMFDNPDGIDPTNKWVLIKPYIPANISGKTVLDVGCNAGYLSIKMKQAGAASVIGIDADPHNIKRAQFLAEVMECKDIEFRTEDAHLFVLTNNEQYDYIIFSRVFYHLRYPTLVFDRLAQMVIKRMFFITEIADEQTEYHPKADYTKAEYSEIYKPEYPKMFFIENKFVGDKTNWWFNNTPFTESLARTAGLKIIAKPRVGAYVFEPDQKDVSKLRREPTVIENTRLFFPSTTKYL